jgi:putative tryptophan/tyrosine transport system substrate-binding protein
MRRREFITLIGGAAAWPIAARAQQQAMPVVGWLAFGSSASDTVSRQGAGFRKGLNQTGFSEGRNFAIETRYADFQYDRLLELAAALVRRNVAAIFVPGIPAARAAKAASQTIPIVFGMGEDPVKEGIVANLNRPGGNVTGFSYFSNQLIGKRLELLREAAPKARTLAFLVQAGHPVTDVDTQEAQRAAGLLGQRLEVLALASERDFDAVFATMAERHVDAFATDSNPFLWDTRAQIIALAARHRIPAIYDDRVFPAAGGLMSYGADSDDMYYQCGVYVGRILKGEKAADLPVQQATKVELTINLKTAKALGVTLPLTLLGRADEVIE